MPEHTGRYILCRTPHRRSSASTSSGGGGGLVFGAPRDLFGSGGDAAAGGRFDQLCAVLVSEPIAGVHTLELIVPHGHGEDGCVVPLQNLADSSPDGLLTRYERGETKGLLVFIGRIDAQMSPRDALRKGARPMERTGCTCSLSLPKTTSKNLYIGVHSTTSEGNDAVTSEVAYSPPIAPIQAFTAALALQHWWSAHGGR